jgi:hypothetical protein
VIVLGAGFSRRHRPAGRPVVHQATAEAAMIDKLTAMPPVAYAARRAPSAAGHSSADR